MVHDRPTPGNDPPAQSGHADAAVAAALRRLCAEDLGNWGEHGFRVEKQRTVRLVLRGQLDGTPAHVKLFRAARLSDRTRDAVRGPKGRAEFEHLLAARELGLPVVEPLAHGHAREGDDRRSFVVTRTIEGAQPFAFPADPTVQDRVGRLLRTVHDLGVHLGDLHCGNLLVDAGGSPWLVDLSSFQRQGRLTLAERAAGLALFCQDLDGGALDPAAQVLLAGYRAAGPVLPEEFADELRLATRRWRAAALPAFGRRGRRSCRHTDAEPKRRGQPRWFRHLDPRVDDAVRARCEQLAASPPPPSKSGRRGFVAVLDDVVVKEREQGASQKLWRASYWLLFAGVPAPRPFALRLFGRRGLVFTARVGGANLADELRAERLDAAALAAAAGNLGDAVGRLHAHGLRNRDLKFDNLVRDPATGAVLMVDLDGVRRKAAEDARGAGADLGRLLAAFHAAGDPGGALVVRAFVRAYLRAHRRLLSAPPMRRLLRRAGERAAQWAHDHAATDGA
ncbi:MAG: lipopolysaccharide kinase InaA family protein [Planctomycetota bacterium]